MSGVDKIEFSSTNPNVFRNFIAEKIENGYKISFNVPKPTPALCLAVFCDYDGYISLTKREVAEKDKFTMCSRIPQKRYAINTKSLIAEALKDIKNNEEPLGKYKMTIQTGPNRRLVCYPSGQNDTRGCFKFTGVDIVLEEDGIEYLAGSFHTDDNGGVSVHASGLAAGYEISSLF